MFDPEDVSSDEHCAPDVRRQGERMLNDLRTAALAEVDGSKFLWFHRKVTLVAGVGFFTDAYDIFAINIAAIMLGYVYGHTPDQFCRPRLSPNQDLGLKIATPIGTFFGQLLFGWLADSVGRKRMYGVELIMMIVGTFGQATAAKGQAMKIVPLLIFWRVVVGLGVGGDYPLSATIASEFAPIQYRGRMMTAVFAAQGWGNLAAAIVATVITMAYRDQIYQDFPACTCTSSVLLCPSDATGINHVDYMWRLLLGLGCVPAAIALYFRLTIPETTRWRMDIERNIVRATTDIQGALAARNRRDQYQATQRADAPRATWHDFIQFFGQRSNSIVLFCVAYSWFAIDVAFYTLGLNSSIILEAINFGGSTDVYQNLYHICTGNIILSLAGLIPGYWVCFLFIDHWGRRPIQIMGFAVLTCLFIIMGASFQSLVPLKQIPLDSAPDPNNYVPVKTRVFVFLYCLANFFQNFGPNTVTFLVPGEIFPTRYRATGHGIAAASGKLGAIVAQVIFSQLTQLMPVDKSNEDGRDGASRQKALALSFGILSVFMATGILSSYFIPETRGQSLETLSKEEQGNFMHPPPTRVHMQNGLIIPMQNLTD
ncbi:phosphate permease [Favolaschia claudopus]|uniref:Phosphate permease n=1 Tax=Favolaschia claudopus TaxID=2862362 RepID=A0AAW0CDL5_9AGAR